MKIAQLQTHVYPEKQRSLAQVEAYVDKVMPEKPDLVTLGEMFQCPYVTQNFPLYAEEEGGDTWQRLSQLAAKHQVYLSAGTVPELDGGKVYNTAYVFDRQGRQIAKHRKVHLFDIDVEGGQSFKESDTLSAGNQVTVFDTEFGKIGICVCFDFRFPELGRLMALKGAKLILVPAAFNMTTGPAHWQIMFRSQALNNQCFVAGTSPARDEASSYVAWGHSLLVSPWGDIIKEAGEKEGFQITEIDLSEADRIRSQLPLLSARRTDVYTLRCAEDTDTL